MSAERIQKLMARANVGSRRACETLIQAGRVRINDRVATLGDKADPQADVITVDGHRLNLKNFQARYFAMYKPINVLSTNRAPIGDDRPLARDIIPYDGHLFTIGRLDVESEGLMVFTNDGELANRLAHPRYEHSKTYKVTVYGIPSQETIENWERGIWLEDARTAPCYIRVMESDKKTTVLRVIMLEGRKRQIRKVASLLGHPVRRLIRTHIGQLDLGELRKGEWAELDSEHITLLTTPADEVKFIRRKNPRPRQYGGWPASPEQIAGVRRRKPDNKQTNRGTVDATTDSPSPAKPRKPGGRPATKPGSPSGSKPGSRPASRPGPKTRDDRREGDNSGETGNNRQRPGTNRPGQSGPRKQQPGRPAKRQPGNRRKR